MRMPPRSLERWLLRWSLGLSALGGVCAAPGMARAQASADSESLKVAREQFGQALALQTGGDWAGALALLKQVAAVKSTPQVRFNIALCEERLGLLVSALGDYELAASDAQPEKSEQVRHEVETRLDALKARVPRVIVRRAEGAEAATISLDGVPLGDSVLNVPLPADPGPHVVEATAAGYLPFKESFRIAEQQTTTLDVKLVPVPAQVEARPVRVSRVVSPGLRNAGYVVGGAGIANLIASGALFYLRHTAISDLDRQCGADRGACPDSARSAADRGQLYTTLGNVTLAVGALSLGVGAALIIVGGHSSEPASVALAPGAPGANAGASFLGRF